MGRRREAAPGNHRLSDADGCADPQCKGQAGARLPQVGHRILLPGNTFGANDTRQELGCLVRGEHVQGKPLRVVPGGEPIEAAAAGHYHQATGATGQQMLDMRRVTGIVEQKKHPLVREHTPEKTGRFINVIRDRAGATPSARRHRDSASAVAMGLAGGVAAEIEKQLPTIKQMAYPVCPPDRQRGLAHPVRTLMSDISPLNWTLHPGFCV